MYDSPCNKSSIVLEYKLLWLLIYAGDNVSIVPCVTGLPGAVQSTGEGAGTLP